MDNFISASLTKMIRRHLIGSDRYSEGLILFIYEIVGDKEDAKGSPSDYRGALYCMCKNAINSIFLHYN